MRTRLSLLAALLSMLLLVAACGAESTPAAAPSPDAPAELAAATATNPPATATPAPTHTSAPAAAAVETPTSAPLAPTDTPLPAPTEAPAPTDTPAVVATFGMTGDGLYFRGNPAAAVTVIDYSDFL
jgi:hypothetical protein